MALETELKYYESRKDELLQHHPGKYALIIGNDLLGVFDNSDEAYKEGIEKRGNVPMLIKLISADEPTGVIPALTLGLLRGNL